ncbi:hypothetical protein ILUMI_13266 [Ignelater luminosus]|uniref:Uncharacterized protein n=1 Tax=Ignelater luminosus TaxID=2038154 RepID=A0A8K0CX22_IGNLU|nr:hypothetical protein ILUMI_13266 [Ignelater luminosus]
MRKEVSDEAQYGNATSVSLQSRPGLARFLSLPFDKTTPERTPLWDGGKSASGFDAMPKRDSRCRLPGGVPCVAKSLATVY